MTVRQAIDKYGIPARQAVMEELKQLIKLQVVKFLPRASCRAKHL